MEGDRPKSYMSTDPEWEARCDADRALVLEETLARLSEGNGRSKRSEAVWLGKESSEGLIEVRCGGQVCGGGSSG